MFFILSKALLFLLSPFFWLTLAVFLAFRLKSERWKKRMKWTALGLFLFFTNSFMYSEFCRFWEIPGRKMNTIQTHDVGIVLGGMSEYNSDLDELSIRRTGDRIFQAITLYKTGKIRKILISGDSGYITNRGLHEAKQMKQILLKWGIPEEDLIAEELSKNTYENALETAKILRGRKDIKSYMLITSGVHMRRSLACFERQGLKCTPFSTDLYTNQKGKYYWDQYIIPNVDNFSQWQRFIKEIIGYLVYDMRGYI